jgi:hypothetical protein
MPKKKTAKRAVRRIPSRAVRAKKAKPVLTDETLAATFVRAVRAGDRTVARKLFQEAKRRSKFGVYDAGKFGRVSVEDLRSYEALTKRKR